MTTQNRGSLYEIELPLVRFLTQGSVANVQGIGSVPRARLERKLGDLPLQAMLEIKQALVFAMDLEIDIENEE
ncbi:MAG: type II toxin-antitoxin system PemK/MazF family toxin [Cyanobacteriota bacterium]|nr:type II toxin-antitoxin system PemK/MazF family toxin [Cyanobacteriota bacterium]